MSKINLLGDLFLAHTSQAVLALVVKLVGDPIFAKFSRMHNSTFYDTHKCASYSLGVGLGLGVEWEQGVGDGGIGNVNYFWRLLINYAH